MEIEDRRDLELTSTLVIKHNCSIRIFPYRYGSGIYILLGYEHLIREIEYLLTGGDLENNYCEEQLAEHSELPVVHVESDVMKGLKVIEEKILSNSKNDSLEKYLYEFSKAYSEIIN